MKVKKLTVNANLFKVLNYVLRKRSKALDWDGILYEETTTAYRSGQIEQKYPILFDDLLSKYKIKVSQEDVKIPVKWEFQGLYDVETRFLCAIALGIKAKKIFEIGTYLGRTTVNLAYNIGEDASIYTLDLPQQLFRVFENTQFEVGKHIKEHKEIANKVTQLLGDSRTFDFSAYYNQIDLMFIDGDHSYNTVLNDGRKAIKCVKNGGFIIWHDFSYGFLGCSKAIIETCERNKLDLNRIELTPLAITKVNK